MSESFEECWAWIDRAIKENWIHARRGTRMKDASLDHLLIRIMEETGAINGCESEDNEWEPREQTARELFPGHNLEDLLAGAYGKKSAEFRGVLETAG